MSIDPPETPGNDGDEVLVGDDSDPSPQPWWPVQRILSVLAGLVLGASVFVVGGMIAIVTGCNPLFTDTALFCPKYEGLSTALEIVVFIPGVAAPLAGGITSAVTSHPRWLTRGCAVGLIAFAILVLLASWGQTPRFS